MTPRNRSRSAVSIALALSLALLASCGSASAPAATLGTTDVTDVQLAHEMDVFGFLAGLNQQPCGTVDGNETEDAACARFALTNLIQEHFVGVYADANDITVSDAQVKQTVKQLDDSLGKKAVNDQLASHDLARTDLSELARRILLFGEVQSAVAADTITDADLRQQYQDGIASYTTVQVDHILVKTRAEADAVYAQVTVPGATEQDFLDLAKQVSTDPSVAQNSGSLGSAVASTYVPPFAAAVLKMEPGEISKPVHTDFGWHVIRMVKKDVQSFDSVKQKLRDSGASAVFNDWLHEQVVNGAVEINPKYGRFDSETLEVSRISSTETGTASPSTSASPSA
ncbi:MAG: peptidylprolyl isomerase [Actinomycetota bacterium]